MAAERRHASTLTLVQSDESVGNAKLRLAVVENEAPCIECRSTIMAGQRALEVRTLGCMPPRYLCRQHTLVSLLGGPEQVRFEQAGGWSTAQHVWHLPDVDPDTLDFVLSRLLPGDVVTLPYEAPSSVEHQLRARAVLRHLSPVAIRHRNEGASA